MPSERVQRQIDQHLDAAEAASLRLDWGAVVEHSQAVLALDPENTDAPTLLRAAESRLTPSTAPTASGVPVAPPSLATDAPAPTSFANGRYTVKRFLGEGGKKKVYLAHDALLDRDVAFALIKTEGLDDASRQRITREAQAMGRLGDHPNIVTVYDIGEENGAPYMVLPVLAGGDVEGVIEKAPDQRMPLERALKIAIETCRGLEFAHGRGIVHRDLKPGNVWLSEDGTAKIGDFGLAVATDRSRLTQAGMMVGTVSYMPPEQAMGGEVGPRSDLYSLGAMLYEMVCGRPPFVGDESVAIIGQHLNTPPVAPTWHRPDCPPALETLILRLLEKDASKRPASATEVREALENVRPTTARVRDLSIATEASASGDNPLYRRTFVGRESEVKQLQAAFDAALSGQGGLVMVVGEPGIGKTAICEQLATYVALRGGKALVGHCYEEGSFSLPYLAFVEAMRSYVLAREPDGLRSDLGTGAADVARIVSEVRDRVQGVELRPAGDPEDDRWRLLQAITSFLRNASTVQPLCIVLEDLHWADRGTLDLLLHVARSLQGARLLVIGTYRDVEVDRSHPLSSALAELSRGATFQRVRLRGLTADEVQRMMAAVAQRDIPWALAELLHRQTEGSPLFVQEMLRYLVEEGLVSNQAGEMRRVGDDPLAGRIPEGLRDVIGKRLTRLGPDSNRLLAIASVIGRDFRLDVLQRVAAMPEDDVFAALEEAKSAAVVEERASVGAVVTYRFSHAFFSQTLYEEISAPRRIRLHQQVGSALEEVFARRLDEHAPELAEHFSHSSDASDLTKAVHYGELAAQRAMSVFDYGEAARLLERTIEVQEVLDSDDMGRRCDLLLELAGALMPAGEPLQAANVVAEEAFRLAERLGDRVRLVRASSVALDALYRFGSAMIYSNDTYGRWAERAARCADEGSLEQMNANRALAEVHFAAGRFADADALLYPALEGAHHLGDATLLAGFGNAAVQGNWPPSRWREAAELAQTYRELLKTLTGHSSSTVTLIAQGLFIASIRQGDRQGAEEMMRLLEDVAERTRDPSVRLQSLVMAGWLLYVDGRLEETLEQSQLIETVGVEWGMAVRGHTGAQLLARVPLVYLGRPEEALAGQDALVGLAGIVPNPAAATNTARLLAESSRMTEAQDALDQLMEKYNASAEGEHIGIVVLGNLLQTAVLVQDRESTKALFDLSVGLPPLAWIAGGAPICLTRLLGDASALLGLPNEARNHYEKALGVCEKARFRPEIAITRLAFAELLLEHYPDEHDSAIEHLDFAIAELRDMKMQPALERALRHRGLLKA